MTLSVLEGHSPIASLFKCDILYLWHVARFLCICRVSCASAGSRPGEGRWVPRLYSSWGITLFL